MTPLLPSHTGTSRKATFGWMTSTAIAGLLVSGMWYAAWAMAQDAGDSIGDVEVAVLIMATPVPALEAVSEPTPDVEAAAPAQQQAETEPEAEEAPDAPEMTEAPTPPDLSTPEEILAEDIPQVDSVVPAPVVEKKPEPKPEKKVEKKPEPKKEPKKKVAKKKEPVKEPSEKPSKKASQESAGGQPSKSAAAAKSSGGGSQAAANYGSVVMKKVNRTRKKNAGARGQTTVGFKIDAGGGVASVWIASSSGSSKLDEVAMDHIRRAAPFPPPPEGAQRSFSFKFLGKGP